MTRTHPLNIPSDPTQGAPRMSTDPVTFARPKDVADALDGWANDLPTSEGLFDLLRVAANTIVEDQRLIEQARRIAAELEGELEQRGRGRLVAWVVGIAALVGSFVAGGVVL